MGLQMGENRRPIKNHDVRNLDERQVTLALPVFDGADRHLEFRCQLLLGEHHVGGRSGRDIRAAISRPRFGWGLGWLFVSHFPLGGT